MAAWRNAPPLLLLLMLILAVPSCWQVANGDTAPSHWQQPASRCAYPQVQQMFDLAKYGLNGCYKLKSQDFIFGDVNSRRETLDASRYLTANLVFIGTVSHVIRDSTDGGAYKIKVQVHCYLKGRLDRDEVEVVGFASGLATGLCLDVKCEDGDTGLFFVTYTDGELRINENGFVREGHQLDSVMKTLRCRENRDWFNVWPTKSGEKWSSRHCQPRPTEPLAEPSCQMSLATAQHYLGVAFIQYESDLKPECQEGKDFVMRQLIKPPFRPTISFSRMSSNGGSKVWPTPPHVAVVATVALASSLLFLQGFRIVMATN